MKKNIFISFSSNIVVSALQFLQIIVVLKILSPNDYGLAISALLIINILASTADLGFGSYLVKGDGCSRIFMAKTFFFVNLFSIFVIIAVGFLSPLIAKFLFGNKEVEGLIVIGLPAVLLAANSQIFFGFFQKKEDFFNISVAEIFCSIFSLMSLILFLKNDLEAKGLILSNVIMHGSKLSYFIFIFSRKYYSNIKKNCDKKINNALSFCFYYTLDRLFNQLSANIDKVIIGKYYGSELLGLYTFAQQLALRPFQLISSVSTRIALPKFASALKLGRINLIESFNNTNKLVSGYSVVIFLAISLLIPIFIELFDLSQWKESANILPILCFISLIYIIECQITNFGIILGKMNFVLISNILSSAIIGIVLYIFRGLEFNNFLLVLLIVEAFTRLVGGILVRYFSFGIHSNTNMKIIIKVIFVWAIGASAFNYLNFEFSNQIYFSLIYALISIIFSTLLVIKLGLLKKEEVYVNQELCKNRKI